MKRYELCMATGIVNDVYDGCVVNDLSDDYKRIDHVDDFDDLDNAMLTMAFFVSIFGVNYTDDGHYKVQECYIYDRQNQDIICMRGVPVSDMPVELQCKHASTDELLSILDDTHNFDARDMILGEIEKRHPIEFSKWRVDCDNGNVDINDLRDYVIGDDSNPLLIL